VIGCARSSDRRAARFERTTTCFPWCRVLTRKTIFTSISHVEAETISCLSIVISLRSFRRGALLTSITRVRADTGGTIGTDHCRIYCGQPHASFLIIIAGIRNSMIVSRCTSPAQNTRYAQALTRSLLLDRRDCAPRSGSYGVDPCLPPPRATVVQYETQG